MKTIILFILLAFFLHSQALNGQLAQTKISFDAGIGRLTESISMQASGNYNIDERTKLKARYLLYVGLHALANDIIADNYRSACVMYGSQLLKKHTELNLFVGLGIGQFDIYNYEIVPSWTSGVEIKTTLIKSNTFAIPCELEFVLNKNRFLTTGISLSNEITKLKSIPAVNIKCVFNFAKFLKLNDL